MGTGSQDLGSISPSFPPHRSSLLASILHSFTSSAALFLASFSPSLLRSSRSLTPGKLWPRSTQFLLALRRSLVVAPSLVALASASELHPCGWFRFVPHFASPRSLLRSRTTCPWYVATGSSFRPPPVWPGPRFVPLRRCIALAICASLAHRGARGRAPRVPRLGSPPVWMVSYALRLVATAPPHLVLRPFSSCLRLRHDRRIRSRIEVPVASLRGHFASDLHPCGWSRERFVSSPPLLLI